MGWGIHPGHSNEVVYMTDIAPTIAAMLHIQMPNGCVGKPILQVLRK
jgi:arylsulfatase A-like enzyme